MNQALIDVMRQIEKSRKVEREVLIEAIQAALVSASRKNYGAAQDIRVVFNGETGDLVAYVKKTVVPEVHEAWHELTLEEARKFKAKAQEGDVLELSISPSEFGRIAAQTAKQVILQRVRECERNAIFEEFQKRQGELINGVVLRQEYKNVIIDLGDTEALLPPREQTPRETYQPGDRVKAYILEIRKTHRGPQVIVSRSHPNLIRKLFEMEVPEVADGVVTIKAVAREAGSRSKVAVASRDKNVDPVGACVGIKGSRIQAIVREVKGEKIDVIAYAENLETLLKAALQPAKINSVILTPDSQRATVIVKDDQLSLAIGKGGQNVRLASKLTGWRIDIVSETQNQDAMRKRAEEAFMAAAPSLDKVPGLTPKIVEKLNEAGIQAVSDFRDLTLERLQEIPGIGPKTAEKVLAAVQTYLPTPPTTAQPERTAAELFAGLGGTDRQPAEKPVAPGELFAHLDKVASDEDATKKDPPAAGSQEEGEPK